MTTSLERYRGLSTARYLPAALALTVLAGCASSSRAPGPSPGWQPPVLVGDSPSPVNEFTLCGNGEGSARLAWVVGDGVPRRIAFRGWGSGTFGGTGTAVPGTGNVFERLVSSCDPSGNSFVAGVLHPSPADTATTYAFAIGFSRATGQWESSGVNDCDAPNVAMDGDGNQVAVWTET